MLGTHSALMNSRLMGTRLSLLDSEEPNSERDKIFIYHSLNICLTGLQIDSLFCPLHIEVGGECDAVVLAIDHKHLVNVDADPNLVRLIWEWKLEFWIILRKANGFWKSLVTLKTVAGERRKEQKCPDCLELKYFLVSGCQKFPNGK